MPQGAPMFIPPTSHWNISTYDIWNFSHLCSSNLPLPPSLYNYHIQVCRSAVPGVLRNPVEPSLEQQAAVPFHWFVYGSPGKYRFFLPLQPTWGFFALVRMPKAARSEWWFSHLFDPLFQLVIPIEKVIPILIFKDGVAGISGLAREKNAQTVGVCCNIIITAFNSRSYCKNAENAWPALVVLSYVGEAFFSHFLCRFFSGNLYCV